MKNKQEYCLCKINIYFLQSNQISLLNSSPKKDEDDNSPSQKIGLNLVKDQRQHELPTYKSVGSENVIAQWREFFQSRVNQWQFHQLFRVFKKIGKDNFASIYLAERIDDAIQIAIKTFSKQTAYAEENGKQAIVNELPIIRNQSQSFKENL